MNLRRSVRRSWRSCWRSAGSGCSYNTFTTQEEAIKGQWGQVEILLQRRHDLIPNLVETTKGFAQQEKDVFQSIADARAKMAGAATPAEKMAAANAETSALARLLVVVEDYPQLKSDETFARLMDELAGNGEPHFGRAWPLQREDHGVQHHAAEVPGEHHRRDLRLQGISVLRGAG